MPISLKYKKLSETSKLLTVADDTGEYEVGVNEGGYSSVNPDRSSFNIGFVATYKKSEGGEGMEVKISSPNNGDVNNSSEWQITLEGAGWYKLAMFAAPNYDPDVVYVQYDIIYNPSLELFYYYINTEDSIPSAFSTANGWAVLKDADIVDKCTMTLQDGFYKYVKNDFLTLPIDVEFTKKSIEYTKSKDCDKCGTSNGAFEIFMLKAASQSLAATGDYISAQDIIENLIDKIGSKNCGCS